MFPTMTKIYNTKFKRTLNNFDKQINNYQKKLPVLDDDTKNIIEYVEEKDTKKKKFKFWELLESDD